MIGDNRPERLVKVDGAVRKTLDVQLGLMNCEDRTLAVVEQDLPEVPLESRLRRGHDLVILCVAKDEVGNLGRAKPREADRTEVHRAGRENSIRLGCEPALHGGKFQHPRKRRDQTRRR